MHSVVIDNEFIIDNEIRIAQKSPNKTLFGIPPIKVSEKELGIDMIYLIKIMDKQEINGN